MSQTAEILEFSPEPKGIGVKDFNALIKATMEGSLPGKYWIQGEVQGLNRNKFRNHWYFDLVDKDEGSEKTASTLKAVIFQGRKTKINQKMNLAGAGELSDGMKVCLQGKIEVYIPSGSYQLIVEDIDPNFTLGDVLRQRRELMLKLEREGLIGRNKLVPIPALPLRIGLITSNGTQAYADFTGTLQRSGFSFQIVVRDARMQGPQTTQAVCSAIDLLCRQKKYPLDVLVICRGGGSVSDLSWFDHEAIARAIALCPLPVITGIGHTMDRSVADELAHYAAVTPTDAAGFLISKAQEAQGTILELTGMLDRLVKNKLNKEELRQNRRREEFLRLVSQKLTHQQKFLSQTETKFPHLVKSTLTKLSHKNILLVNEVVNKTEKVTSLNYQKIKNQEIQLLKPSTFQRFFNRKKEPLNSRKLEESLKRRVETQVNILTTLDRVIQAHDPKVVLKRGFSILRDKQGRVLKTKTDVLKSPQVQAEMVDGVVSLTPKLRIGLFEEEE